MLEDIRDLLKIIGEFINKNAAKFLTREIFIIGVVFLIFGLYIFYEQVNFELAPEKPTPIINNSDNPQHAKNRLLAEKALILSMTREAGKDIATSIQNMNLRLFNDDPEIIEEQKIAEAKNFKAPDIKIKALLLGDGGKRAAIIDTPTRRGMTIKTGSKILNGRVVKINSAGVIIDFENVQVMYNAE